MMVGRAAFPVGQINTFRAEKQAAMFHYIHKRPLPLIGFMALIGLFITGLKADRPEHGDGKVCRHNAVVQAPTLNVLYYGIVNEVNIEIPSKTAEKVYATLTPKAAGHLERVKEGVYKVHLLSSAHKTVKINVSQDVGDGKVRAAGATEFKVINLPAPVASIGGNPGPSITSEELSKVKVVQVDLMDFPLHSIDYEVTRYDYIYKPTRGNLIRGSIQGDIFPKDLKDAFDAASRGDLLIISGIQAAYQGYEKDVYGSLVYTVLN